MKGAGRSPTGVVTRTVVATGAMSVVGTLVVMTAVVVTVGAAVLVAAAVGSRVGVGNMTTIGGSGVGVTVGKMKAAVVGDTVMPALSCVAETVAVSVCTLALEIGVADGVKMVAGVTVPVAVTVCAVTAMVGSGDSGTKRVDGEAIGGGRSGTGVRASAGEAEFTNM